MHDEAGAFECSNEISLRHSPSFVCGANFLLYVFCLSSVCATGRVLLCRREADDLIKMIWLFYVLLALVALYVFFFKIDADLTLYLYDSLSPSLGKFGLVAEPATSISLLIPIFVSSSQTVCPAKPSGWSALPAELDEVSLCSWPN